MTYRILARQIAVTPVFYQCELETEIVGCFLFSATGISCAGKVRHTGGVNGGISAATNDLGVVIFLLAKSITAAVRMRRVVVVGFGFAPSAGSCGWIVCVAGTFLGDAISGATDFHLSDDNDRNGAALCDVRRRVLLGGVVCPGTLGGGVGFRWADGSDGLDCDFRGGTIFWRTGGDP